MSFNFRICKLSKIGADGAVFSQNTMILKTFFCKIETGSRKEG